MPGTADVRRGAADLELRVALDDLLSPDEAGRYDWYETSKKTVPIPARTRPT